MNTLPATVGREVLKLQAGSPRILFGVGLAAMVGSTVLACKATLKADEVLEQTKENLIKVKSLQHENYTERDRQKDITVVYAQSAFEFSKLYGPAIVAGVIGVACLTKSHQILTNRNTAIMAAYAALDKGFREYRARVVDKLGAEQDREFRYGTEEIVVHNPETGKDETVTRVNTHTTPSIYARFFDQYCGGWSKDASVNLVTANVHQKYANDLLRTRGHLFLNEVYTMFGMDHTQAGSVVGWVMNRGGDGYVDFGIYDPINEQAIDFVNGRNGVLLLDFNVDGVIYDKIDTPRENLSWQRG